jgi:hypothetical protein
MASSVICRFIKERTGFLTVHTCGQWRIVTLWTGRAKYNLSLPPKPIIKESEEYLCPYLNVHILRVYFLCYKVCPFSLPTPYSFCAPKNILKKRAVPHCDLHLQLMHIGRNTMNAPPRVGEGFRPWKSHLCFLSCVDHTDCQRDWCFILQVFIGT